ncbi:MAG: TIGR04086 family membrane protein [Ruminococcaceae bacterium]|nr:TIGR04086 family membrane protein [Oscillospiraceae bacterium]
MFYRILKGNAETIKIISKLLLMVTVCLVTVILLFCAAAFAISNIDFTYESLPVIIASILSIASAFDGFVISKIFKKNGLFWGVFAGAVIFAFIFIISLKSGTFNVTSDFFTKMVICIIAGAIGGITGVNVN